MTAENPELVQQLEKLKALSDKLHESKVCMSICLGRSLLNEISYQSRFTCLVLKCNMKNSEDIYCERFYSNI